MRAKIITITFLLLISTTAAFAQTLGPEETVKAFYRYSNARSSTFNGRHIRSRKQWYTPALYDAFQAALRADLAYLKANPTDKPKFGDGLTFGPLDEPCVINGKQHRRKRSIDDVSTKKTRSEVYVKFTYPKACGIIPVTYQISLQKIRGKWLIDNFSTFGRSLTYTGEEG